MVRVEGYFGCHFNGAKEENERLCVPRPYLEGNELCRWRPVPTAATPPTGQSSLSRGSSGASQLWSCSSGNGERCREEREEALIVWCRRTDVEFGLPGSGGGEEGYGPG